jgi:hypothetical protein
MHFCCGVVVGVNVRNSKHLHTSINALHSQHIVFNYNSNLFKIYSIKKNASTAEQSSECCTITTVLYRNKKST